MSKRNEEIRRAADAKRRQASHARASAEVGLTSWRAVSILESEAKELKGRVKIPWYRRI